VATRAFADIDHDDRLRQSLLQLRTSLMSGPPLWLYMPHPLTVRALRRSLDGFADLLAVADRPWPERIDAMNAIDASIVPLGPLEPSADKRRQVLKEFTRITANQVRRIRCARLLLTTMPLSSSTR